MIINLLTALENLGCRAAPVFQVGFRRGTDSAQEGSDLTSGCFPVPPSFSVPHNLHLSNQSAALAAGRQTISLQIQESSAENAREKSALNLCSFHFTLKPSI